MKVYRKVKASDRLPDTGDELYIMVNTNLGELIFYYDCGSPMWVTPIDTQKEPHFPECKNPKWWLEPEGERPTIKEYFGDNVTLDRVHETYIEQPELFQYAQALDRYIDNIESPPQQPSEGEVYVKCKKEEADYTLCSIEGTTCGYLKKLPRPTVSDEEAGYNEMSKIVDVLVEHISPTEEELNVTSNEGWPKYNERILKIATEIKELN